MAEATWGNLSQSHQFWQKLFAWQSQLEEQRGQRAELRRAQAIIQVMLTEAFQTGFLPVIEESGFEVARSWQLEPLAMTAGLLASVKFGARTEGPELPFAQRMAMSGKQGVKGAAVHKLRFRRLLAIDGARKDELYRALIRMIRMTDGFSAPAPFGRPKLADLVKAAFVWNEQLRRNWALDYYRIAPKNA